MSKAKQQNHIRLTTVAVLTAAAVVIDCVFSTVMPNIKIGATFIPVLICGMLYGTFWGGVCYGMTDFLSANILPKGGAYNPVFTLTAFLIGLCFGLIGYCSKKIKNHLLFSFLAVIIIIFKELVLSLLLNTFWLHHFYGSNFSAIFISRLPVSAITVVLESFLAIIARLFILPRIKKSL